MFVKKSDLDPKNRSSAHEKLKEMVEVIKKGNIVYLEGRTARDADDLEFILKAAGVDVEALLGEDDATEATDESAVQTNESFAEASGSNEQSEPTQKPEPKAPAKRVTAPKKDKPAVLSEPMPISSSTPVTTPDASGEAAPADPAVSTEATAPTPEAPIGS